MFRRTVRTLRTLALCALASSPAVVVTAQSRTYPAGVGSVSLAYQRINNTGHRLSDGFLLNEGQSVSQAIAAEFTYGVTERLTLSAGLPYVSARYTGAGPTPFQFLPVDADRRWHGSFQDAGLAARYQAMSRGPFALTPGVALLIPSHAYQYRGEAVVGQRLREVQLALSASRTLVKISSRLEIGGSYAYTFVQAARVDVPNDRSNAGVDLGYQLTSRLQAFGGVRWQRTHGGLRAGSFTGPLPLPGDIDTAERILEHDRLLRDNSLHLEVGAAYSRGRVDVFSSYLAYVSGTDTHAGRAITAGATCFFGAMVAGK
jgi:hypothetical protein